MPDPAPGDVLVVAADAELAGALTGYLGDRGYRVEAVDSTEKAFNCMDGRPYPAVVTELRDERIDGMRIAAVAQERNPDVCVVIVAGDQDQELATEAMRQGAYDFQTKPVNLAKVDAVIKRGFGDQRLLHEQSELRRRLDERYGLTSIIGQSRAILRAYEGVRQAAQTTDPVIVLGEAGTGKGHVAQAVHNNSPRRDASFVALDCRGRTTPSLEEELFGQGGKTRRPATGRLELADHGTLYLNNVQALSDRFYTPLLQALTGGTARRKGEERRYRADVRFVFGALPDSVSPELEEFLAELREKHSALSITLPPLRDRKDDIPLLVDHFIAQACEERGKQIPGISRNAVDLLSRYEWPGNVLELKNTVEGMVLSARDGHALDVLDVPSRLRQRVTAEPGTIAVTPGTPLREVERLVIEETLKACDYKKDECARVLGIGLRTLYRKLKEYEGE